MSFKVKGEMVLDYLHIPIGYFIGPIDNNNDFTAVQLRWHLSIIFAWMDGHGSQMIYGMAGWCMG